MVCWLLLESVESVAVCANVRLILIEGCHIASFVIFLQNRKKQFEHAYIHKIH